MLISQAKCKNFPTEDGISSFCFLRVPSGYCMLHLLFDDLDKECKAGNLGFQEHGSMNKLHCLSREAKDIFGKSNVALYLHGCRFLLRQGPSWPRTDLSFSLARASGFCSASFRHLPSQL